VDDFDGVFQHLPVTPGEHELLLYLDGYRTVKQKIYVTPRNTFKVKYQMEPLGAGEQPEPRPTPPSPPPQPAMQQPPAGPGVRQLPPAPMPLPPPGAPQSAQVSVYGTLAIRVQPDDAEIQIDGERWRGPEGQERLLVQVPEGRHTIQIEKSGYRTY